MGIFYKEWREVSEEKDGVQLVEKFSTAPTELYVIDKDGEEKMFYPDDWKDARRLFCDLTGQEHEL